MLLQNNNSKNLIKIGLCEIGSYLYINKPIVLDWSDCDGSMGRFCSLLNEENEIKDTLQEELNGFLYNDYTDNLSNLYNDFQPLFNVLENGKYFINFQLGENKPIDFTFLEFPKSSNYTQSELLNETEEDVLRFTANWYFDFKIVPIIATQLKSNIDFKVVEFYKKEIIDGKRPFIITLYKSFITDKPVEIKEYMEYSSSYFLLDGHHKFLAYKELGIYPPVFSICRGFFNINELNFDFNLLKNYLNKYQINHLLRNI